MTVQPYGWRPDFIKGAGPTGAGAGFPKMNIVRCPQVPNDVCTMQCFSFS